MIILFRMSDQPARPPSPPPSYGSVTTAQPQAGQQPGANPDYHSTPAWQGEADGAMLNDPPPKYEPPKDQHYPPGAYPTQGAYPPQGKFAKE